MGVRLEMVRWAQSRSTSRELTPSWLNVKENKSLSAKLGKWFIGSGSAINPCLNCCWSDSRRRVNRLPSYVFILS